MKKYLLLPFFALTLYAQGPRLTGSGTLSVAPVFDISSLSTTASNVASVTASNVAEATTLNRIRYVSTTGSDANSGTLDSPFATLTNAVESLDGNGTVMVRGGNYFNQSVNLIDSSKLSIIAYSNEVNNFYYGEVIASGSFTHLSNGIHTATMTVNFSNSITFLTNFWDAWSPEGRGIYLFQTNVPFGAQTALGYYAPPMLRAAGETNRCEHTPILRATSIASMVNSNGYWFIQDDLLYIKFAVSNQVGGIYLSGTNYSSGNDSFIYGGTPKTEIYLKGIRSYFGSHGFNYSGCGRWDFENCLAFGSGYNGFHADNDEKVTGAGSLAHCEGSAVNGFAFTYNGRIQDAMVGITETGCYWHDYRREASAVRECVNRTVNGSIAFGGFGQFGFIDQGTSSTYLGCSTYSNTVAGFQLGSAGGTLGRRSYQGIFNCYMIGDNVGVKVDDMNNVVISSHNFYSPFNNQSPINVTANPTTHYIQSVGDVQIGGLDPIIEGAGTTDTTRYVMRTLNYGGKTDLIARDIQLIGGDSIAGNSFYLNNTVKFTAAGVARFSGDIFADGGMAANSSGFKHARVTTGSIDAASSALVTVTWGTTFADANYSVSASVVDSTTASLALSVVHIESISASAVTVRVENSSAGALTGTLHVIAVHD